jgi:hypothetical protein
MEMNCEYKDGKLILCAFSVLNSISTETKAELIDALSCERDVIRNVTDQILDGWTQNDSHGAKSVVAQAEPSDGLDWACREVAKRSGEVAKREIERLEEAVKVKDEHIQHLHDELSKYRFPSRGD